MSMSLEETGTGAVQSSPGDAVSKTAASRVPWSMARLASSSAASSAPPMLHKKGGSQQYRAGRCVSPSVVGAGHPASNWRVHAPKYGRSSSSLQGLFKVTQRLLACTNYNAVHLQRLRAGGCGDGEALVINAVVRNATQHVHLHDATNTTTCHGGIGAGAGGAWAAGRRAQRIWQPPPRCGTAYPSMLQLRAVDPACRLAEAGTWLGLFPLQQVDGTGWLASFGRCQPAALLELAVDAPFL